MLPVKWPAMQIHHRLDVKPVIFDAVNDGVGKAMKVELAIVAPDFAPLFRFVQDSAQRGLIFLKKITAQTRLVLSYQSAAASNSLWNFRMRMTRMEPGPNVPHYLRLWTGVHPAPGHLAGAPVNDFISLRLGVRVHGVIKAGNELAGQTGPVLLRQAQRFARNFFGDNAHGQKVVQTATVQPCFTPSLPPALPRLPFHLPARARRRSCRRATRRAQSAFSAATNSAVNSPPLMSVLRKNSQVDG